MKDRAVDVFSKSMCALFFLCAYYALLTLTSGAQVESSVLEWLTVFSVDFFYLLAGVTVIGGSAFVLSAVNLRKASNVLLIAGVLLLFILLFVEFRFFAKTGSYFSLSMAIYALENWGEMNKVLQSGVDSSGLIAGGMALLFAFAALVSSISMVARKACFLVVFCGGSLAITSLMAGNLTGTDEFSSSQAEGVFSSFMDYSRVDSSFDVSAVDYSYSVKSFEGAVTIAPNIIVFVSESTRADVISGFSGEEEKAQMPTLTWLQSGGISFDRAYTTTSHTSKALVGILCGVHPAPFINIVEATPGGIPVQCLPQILQQFGYSSLFIQSATSEFEGRHVSVRNMGFDKFIGKEAIEAGYKSSGYFGVDEMAMFKPFEQWWDSVPVQTAGKSPRLAVFLTSMTHHPYQELGAPVESQLSKMKQGYLKNLGRSDELLGKVFESLRARGELDNTIVIFTGDHGEGFGEHGVYQHDAVPFEEGVRVPLVIWDGRHPMAARKDDALRQHIDIVPTLLDSIGIKTQGEFPGVSLHNAAGHQQIITSCWGVGDCKALVQKDMKWIFHSASKRLQAYSLIQDPYERNNIASEFSIAQRRDVVATIKYGSAGVAKFYANVPDGKSSKN